MIKKNILSITILFLLIGCATVDERLYDGIRENDIKKINNALSEGAKINNSIIYDSDIEKRRNMYPLIEAIKIRNRDIIDLLLSKNAKVNIKDEEGNTPLIIASESGDIDTVRLLISKGADINAKNDMWKTPLIKAAENGHIKIEKLLKKKKAKLNVRDKKGRTYSDYKERRRREERERERERKRVERNNFWDNYNYSTIMCNDGTYSPSCTTCKRGCCRGHGGCR